MPGIDNSRLRTMSEKQFSKQNKTEKKWIRCKDAVEIYSVGKTKLMEIALKAGAIIKIDKTIIIDREKLEQYMESYRLL